MNEEGIWEWVTREAFDYTNWGNGQPDAGYENGEDYLGILGYTAQRPANAFVRSLAASSKD